MTRWRGLVCAAVVCLSPGAADAQSRPSASPLFDLLDQISVAPADLRALIARGAPLEAPAGYRNLSPLLKAIARAGGPMNDTSDLALVRILIDAGAGVDRAAGSETPLCLAIRGRRAEDIVILLLRARANPNAACNDETPLDIAVRYKSVDIATMLLEAGARLPDITGKTNATPLLSTAAMDGSARMVELLIRHGAAVDARGIQRTPLMSARTVDAARVLIAHGADVHARDGFGQSVLAIHMKAAHPRIVALLRTHGATDDDLAPPAAGSTRRP
jgi:hypothetical protein